MLTEVDLHLLEALHASLSIAELSERTGYGRGYVSERVSRLENLGLIETTERNRAKKVRALQTAVLDTYTDLTAANPNTDFPSLISPSMLRVCWFLDRPATVSEMAHRLTLRRRRIYQLLEQLQSRGFITKFDSQYALTERQAGLAHFSRAVIKHEHRHRIHAHLPRATIVWTGPHEALITVEDESLDAIQDLVETQQQWHSTGLARFAAYGLEFFTRSPQPYFYSDFRETLQPVDFIAHTLMYGMDTRNVSYCALLMAKSNLSIDELRSSAGYYGIEETIDDLVRFVEARGEADSEHTPFPDWQAMESLAEQYGVTL